MYTPCECPHVGVAPPLGWRCACQSQQWQREWGTTRTWRALSTVLYCTATWSRCKQGPCCMDVPVVHRLPIKYLKPAKRVSCARLTRLKVENQTQTPILARSTIFVSKECPLRYKNGCLRPPTVASDRPIRAIHPRLCPLALATSEMILGVTVRHTRSTLSRRCA